VAQRVHPVSRDRKKDLLAHLILQGDWHQVLVFMRTKHGANRLTEFLNKCDITAMAIHGNKSQSARTKALADFKSGELRVLVATDIAARGIDIDQLPHVVNFELPNVPEDYVHRIGRTGRAGASGEAISLACVDEEIFLRDIQRLIHKDIPREVIKGFEPDPNERAEPIVLGRMTIGVGGNQRNEQWRRPPSRPSQGRAAKPPHPSRASNPLQGTHAPRDAVHRRARERAKARGPVHARAPALTAADRGRAHRAADAAADQAPTATGSADTAPPVAGCSGHCGNAHVRRPAKMSLRSGGKSCGSAGASCARASQTSRRAVPVACGTTARNSRGTDARRSPGTARTHSRSTPTPAPTRRLRRRERRRIPIRLRSAGDAPPTCNTPVLRSTKG
jgi:superfamily II DNA/RNA helicase